MMFSSAAGRALGLNETIWIGTTGVISSDAKARLTGNRSAVVKVSL
jgi:hypothetical protein